MGCKGNSSDDNGCTWSVPPGNEGVTFEFREYPDVGWRGGSYNIPDRDANAIEYPSVWIENPSGGSAPHNHPESACGKLSKPRTKFNNPGTQYYDYYPEELSFDYALSDTWFSYLFFHSQSSIFH